MGPSHKSHPLYKYRRILNINAALSLILGVLALANTQYNFGIWILHLIFAAFSGCICVYDLLKWAAQKAADPDHDPKWPLKFVLVVDALLAVLCVWMFLAEVADSSACYYSCTGTFFEAYASLTTLVASILHLYCFWKQTMAIKHKEWLQKLPTTRPQCENCNRTQYNVLDSQVDQNFEDEVSNRPSQRTVFPEAFGGRSPVMPRDMDAHTGMSTRSTCLITPTSEDESDFSDSLLVTKGTGYGTMQSGPVRGEDLIIRHQDDDTTVVKKKKKNPGKNKSDKNKSRSGTVDGVPFSFA